MTSRGHKTVISDTLVGMSLSGRQRHQACLVQFAGADLGRPFFLTARTLIGRDPRANIRVDERKVSRAHCEILVVKGAALVRDMESSNGTWVNGRRIDAKRELKDGDMVSVGSATFKFFAPGNIEQLFYDRVYREKTIDEKTKVFNDKYLMSTLRSEIDVSASFGRELSVMMYDLDHFKMVNDTFGHRFGDVVLATTAEIVSGNLRLNDDLCRYGGEEFVIILRETSLRTAVKMAERVRQAVAKHVFSPGIAGKPPKHVQTMSIGVLQVTAATADVGKLMKAVDTLLYRAKKEGRNRVAA